MPFYDFLGLRIFIPDLTEITSAITAPLTATITSGLSGLVTSIQSGLTGVLAPLAGLFQSAIDGLSNLSTTIINAIGSGVGYVAEFVTGALNQLILVANTIIVPLQTGITEFLSNIPAALAGFQYAILTGSSGLMSTIGLIPGVIASSISGAISDVVPSLSSLSSTLSYGLMGAASGLGSMIGSGLGELFGGFGTFDPIALMGDTSHFVLSLDGLVENIYAKHSPMVTQDAWTDAQRLRNDTQAQWQDTLNKGWYYVIASLGQVGHPMNMMLSAPAVKAAMDLSTTWYAAPYEIGYTPLLERYFLAHFVPKIPDFQSMMSIYVKEGYLEDHWVEMPAEMTQNFRELGFSDDWSKRLWGQHWVYPNPTQLYEMLHRTAGNFPEIGVTTDVLRTMLKLHDFEPKWRAPLEAISWNTWRIFDIRTAWEMNLDPEETLVKRLVDSGYEPRDASLLAEVQKMFVLRSEIDQLLTESNSDFVNGFIDEVQLRANYEATPYRAEVVDLRIERAKQNRARVLKNDYKAALLDRFNKGDLDETELATELGRIGITQDFIAAEVERAKAKAYKKITDTTAIKTAILAEAKYDRAFKVGLVDEATYRAKLALFKYKNEDVDLLVDLNRPEKPTVDEIPTLTLAELKSAFRVGILGEEDLAAELARRRYTPGDITIIVTTEKAKLKPVKIEKVVPPEKLLAPQLKDLTLGELKAAFRALIVSSMDLTAEMLARAYSSDAAIIVIFTELSGMKETELRTAFRHDIIAEDELTLELTRREYTPQQIRALVDEEKVKKQQLAGV